MLRTVQLLPKKGPSTLAFDAGPPDSYPDRTHTGKRRRARTTDHPFTRPPPIPLGAQTVPLTAINDSPGGSYEWLKGGGDGGRNLDARTLFFYRATLNTPAMMYKMVGAGSQYAGVSTDSDGNVFDGGKAYRLTIPADVPAKNFWSVVVYDTQTRSELQTGQPLLSKEQPARGRGREPGWFGGPLLRACRAGRSGSELDRNGAG